ncbi:unnamed protein product [Rotaria socialis]|uniref:Uncharacterized protein n=1 Tax=Rotaria socialis TaxID=392032 RepID=A0A821M0G3_9BILA|nr:unnamed protein product [Rotaria socialis]
MTFKQAIYIVAAGRTPFGTFGGKLKDYTAIDLQEAANRGALKQAKLSPEAIDITIIALRVGVPIRVPALNMNRLCESGSQSVINGGQEVELRDSNIVLCGGTEKDTLWASLTDDYYKTPMTITDNFGNFNKKKYKITRQEADEFALQSEKRKNGQDEIFDTDEHPRPQTTIEQLSKLPFIFIKNAGIVTAAIENLLKKVKKQVSDIDLFDINEAFAPQFLACQKVSKLPNEKSNVNGSAIVLGHPLTASGARITANLVYGLRRRQGKYAIGAACIGSGQGIALLLERI